MVPLSAFLDLGFWLNIAVALPVGLVFGYWADQMIDRDRQLMQRPPATAREQRSCIIGFAIVFALLCGGLYLAVAAGWQATPEVIPSQLGFLQRRTFHQLLIGLILVATVVDWDGYIIPDQITFPGMLIGLFAATVIGELQLIHLWVDWSYAVPDLRGPYFPDWFDRYRRLHGFAWSATGVIVGAGLTWTVRAVSSRLMGRETLGFGDVTFMGMIGSFLGWQPTVCAFLIAPLLGLVVGIPLKLMTNKPFIPYGPFLGIAAIGVLFAWGPIWLRTRGIFGDAFGLLILAALAGLGFVLLLGMMVAYRSIPGKTERVGDAVSK